MEKALLAYLKSQSTLIDLVGQRIALDALMQVNVYPKVRISKVSNVPQYVYGAPSGWWEARVQIDVTDPIDNTSQSVQSVIKGLLSGASFTQDGVNFERIFIIDERQNVEGNQNESALIYRHSVDYRVLYKV